MIGGAMNRAVCLGFDKKYPYFSFKANLLDFGEL